MAPFGASRAGLMSVAADDIPDSGGLHEYWASQEDGFDDEDPINTLSDQIADNDLSGTAMFREDDLGGRDAIDYDGTDDGHSGDSAADDGEYTLLFVARLDSVDDSGDRTLYSNGDFGNDGFALRTRGGTFNVTHGGVASEGGSSADTDRHLFTVRYDGSNLNLRIDGVDDFDRSVGYNSAGENDDLTVGKAPSDSENTNMTFGFARPHDRHIDGEELDDMEQSLADFYDINLS